MRNGSQTMHLNSSSCFNTAIDFATELERAKLHKITWSGEEVLQESFFRKLCTDLLCTWDGYLATSYENIRKIRCGYFEQLSVPKLFITQELLLTL